MKYQNIKKYKYRVYETVHIETNIEGYSISHDFFKLSEDGILTIFLGYLWDGVSGPTIDSDCTMIPGLCHDVLYQAIRLRLLPLSLKRDIDLEFKRLLLKYGSSKFRADYYYLAVFSFGWLSCIPGNVKIPKVLEV